MPQRLLLMGSVFARLEHSNLARTLLNVRNHAQMAAKSAIILALVSNALQMLKSKAELASVLLVIIRTLPNQ